MKRMGYFSFGLTLLAALSFTQIAHADEKDGGGKWKQKHMECLTSHGLTQDQAKGAMDAMRACHDQAKAAGKEGWKEVMKTCMDKQPANVQAAMKACHHHHKKD